MTPGKKRSNHITIRDVAGACGLSASTVSIVLNEAPLSKYVAAKTKENIHKTARAMGYRPDAFARSLRNRRSHTIGVMVFDISDPFCTLILRGIEKTLYPTSYLPIIMDAHNDAKQLQRYLEMLLERRVEGLIVVANWLFAEFELPPDYDRNHIPTVVVGRDLSAQAISSIVVDNASGAYAAMDHLYGLGHRQIAYIRGPKKLHDSASRWRGIRSFARKHKLPIDSALVMQLPDAVDPNSGFECGIELTAGLLASGAKFTAIVAFDDLTALGALRALHQAGRRVPEDCSIIGFDDVPPAALASPGISTIQQPMEAMGDLAAVWIMESLGTAGADGGPRPVCLMPAAVVGRESTQSVRLPVTTP